MTVKELHSIKRFRAGNLGIIRLNHLSNIGKTIIKIGDEEFKPVGYDTYGHPIISEENFAYYKALKSIKERDGDSLVAEVEYEIKAFAIRRDVYDSVEGIMEVASKNSVKSDLKHFKDMLILRKQAYFCRKELNIFILYGKYALYNDGHVYTCRFQENECTPRDKTVLELSQVDEFELLEEIHLPRTDDVCCICGKGFCIEDIKEFSVTEDEKCNKAHKECLSKYTEKVNYQKASKIIDSVYQDVPKSEVIKVFDDEKQKERIWYLYHTNQGDVAIRFKNKVIEIKWFGNFKPFNIETLFANEDVTKKKLEDSKIIHAWSIDDAIKYLTMVRKA